MFHFLKKIKENVVLRLYVLIYFFFLKCLYLFFFKTRFFFVLSFPYTFFAKALCSQETEMCLLSLPQISPIGLTPPTSESVISLLSARQT